MNLSCDRMNFKEYIELHRNSVYSKICEYVPIKDPEEHYRLVREYSDRQGSYRRPGLLMLSGQVFGAMPEDLILPAAAMQVSEDWILVHDDIEDHSEMRRGKPALQVMCGYEIAINAGDSLHITMWKMLKDYIIAPGNKAKGNKIYEKFYDMLEHTVEGQYIEDNFIYNVREIGKASEDLYFRIINSKTCYYTVYGPMQIGAIAARSNKGTLNLLEKIGTPAGIAFQIVDDVLDMTADEKVFGKKRYGDLYEGKVTLIMLETYKNASKEEKERIDSIYKKGREHKTEDDINYLLDKIDRYGGIEYAKGKAEHYGEAAKKAVERSIGKLPHNEYTDIMLSAMEELYLRKK